MSLERKAKCFTLATIIQPSGDCDKLLSLQEKVSLGGFFRLSESQAGEIASFSFDEGLEVRRIFVEPHEDVKAKIAAAWEFPEYFGANWDAVVDCWSSMSGQSFLTIFSGSVVDEQILSAVSQVVADRYREDQRTFSVLIF